MADLSFPLITAAIGIPAVAAVAAVAASPGTGPQHVGRTTPASIASYSNAACNILTRPPRIATGMPASRFGGPNVSATRWRLHTFLNTNSQQAPTKNDRVRDTWMAG